jgi:replicative DNA helicase
MTQEHEHLRLPPASLEAEQAVIGAVLLDPQALVRLADRRLRPEHFFDHRNLVTWEAITHLAARHLPTDPLSVFEHLRDANSGDAEIAGGLAYLNALVQGVPSLASVPRYADIVVDKALHRAVIRAADQAAALAYEPGDPDQLLDQVASIFAAVKRTRAVSEPQALSALVTARIDHWSSLAKGDTVPGISTGLPRLDEALGGGVKPGRVIVLAARPSVGKTSLAGQVGLNVAAGGHPVLMLSQEMAAGDLVDRVVANLGQLGLDRITTGQFRDDDWARVTDAADAAARLPFDIDDQAALTLLDIRAKVRQVQQRRGGLALLIVDYLQLCASSGNFERRHHQIEQISRGMKQLAKELDVCVLVLSQLNREGGKGEPELDSLKESGAIEEDADTVILLHPMGHEADGSLLVLAKVPKNRQGRRGRIALALYGKTQRWAESAASVSRRARGEAS